MNRLVSQVKWAAMLLSAVAWCGGAQAQRVRTPGPLGGAGTIGVREVIANGEVNGSSGSRQSLNNIGPDAIVRDYQAPLINFIDWKGVGPQSFEVARLGDVEPGLVNDLAMVAHGRVRIPEAGEYSFLIQSDDGFEFWLLDQSAIAVQNASKTAYGAFSYDANRAPSASVGVFQLEAGEFDFELIYNERGGGAMVQLAAQKGFHTSLAPEDRTGFVPIGAPSLHYEGTAPRIASPWSAREVHRVQGPALLSLDDARNLLQAPDEGDRVFEGTVERINLSDPNTRYGDLDSFGDDSEFLYFESQDAAPDNFAFHAQSTLVIETSGQYTFGFNSDDGGELTIAGAEFTSIYSPTKASITNNGQSLTADFESPTTLRQGEEITFTN